MSPYPSPDAKAIVRAAEALTAQVRRIADHLAAGARQDSYALAPPATTGDLRELVGSALLDYLSRTADIRPGRNGEMAFMPEVTDAERLRMADAAIAAILPTTKLLGELARSADADVKRVITLYERWVKAGPPQLGTSVARWWDTRLAELHAAILPPEQDETPAADQPKEQ